MTAASCCDRYRQATTEQRHGHVLEHELGPRAAAALALESTGSTTFRAWSIEDRAHAATGRAEVRETARRLLRPAPSYGLAVAVLGVTVDVPAALLVLALLAPFVGIRLGMALGRWQLERELRDRLDDHEASHDARRMLDTFVADVAREADRPPGGA